MTLEVIEAYLGKCIEQFEFGEMNELNELIRMNNVHAAYHGDIYILNGVSLSIKRNKNNWNYWPKWSWEINCFKNTLWIPKTHPR